MYYKLPLRFKDLTEKGDLQKCRGVDESIGQNLQMMLVTEYGEYHYDDSYGCDIWEHDFENILGTNQWKEKLAASIKEVILQHEKRLSNITVKADIGQEEIGVKEKSQLQRIKRKIEVRVSATIEATSQPFNFVGSLFISPLSFD